MLLITACLLMPATAAWNVPLTRAKLAAVREESQAIRNRLGAALTTRVPATGKIGIDAALAPTAAPKAQFRPIMQDARRSPSPTVPSETEGGINQASPSSQNKRKPKAEVLSPVQRASADLWLQQYQRTRDIGYEYYNNAAEKNSAAVGRPIAQTSRPRTRAASPQPVMVVQQPGYGPQRAQAQPPQSNPSSRVQAPRTVWQEQGLAGAARQAKVQNELSAFRAQMQSHRFPVN